MSSTPQQNSPKARFDLCKRREENLKENLVKLPIDELRRLTTKALIFPPIFVPPQPAIQAEDKIDEAVWMGSKYRDLLERLKKARDRKTRWIVLARWLRQENLCEPEDFLPEEFNLDSFIRELWEGKDSRRDDPFDVALIEIWLPYFRQLMADTEALRQRNVRRIAEELIRMGYDPAASALAAHESSALETLYAWLANRGEDSSSPEQQPKRRLSAATFRNALYRAKRGVEKLLPGQAAMIFEREIKELGQQPEFMTPLKAQPSRRRKKKAQSQQSSTPPVC
jgi:hypothetical protein